MITISTSELKRFLYHAKNIRDNRILPILSYVKLECKGNSATLTKSNLNSFVVCEIKAEFKKDETILIDQQTLSACVNFGKGKEVKITLKNGNVIMDDGFRELKSQCEDEKNFPEIETNTGEKTPFDADVMASLSLAKSHTLPAASGGMREWKCFVHVLKIENKSFIVGISGAVSYFKSFKQKMPEISLDPETVAIITKFPEADYSSNDRYDYFQHEGTTYGFIKAETGRPQLEGIFDKFKSEDSLTVNRKDLVDFCEMVQSFNGTTIPPEVSMINVDKNKVLLKYIDLTGVEKASEPIAVEGKTFDIPDILFLPKNLLIVMKDLGVEKIKIEKIMGNMIVSSPEEKNYTGSIMELSKL
jgi:hypothetical protein